MSIKVEYESTDGEVPKHPEVHSADIDPQLVSQAQPPIAYMPHKPKMDSLNDSNAATPRPQQGGVLTGNIGTTDPSPPSSPSIARPIRSIDYDRAPARLLKVLSSGHSTQLPVSKRKERMRVIVVGGGVAGLKCAAELKRFGAEVKVIEARERLGGRIQTLDWNERQGSDGSQLPPVRVDVGASYLMASSSDENEVWDEAHKQQIRSISNLDGGWHPTYSVPWFDATTGARIPFWKGLRANWLVDKAVALLAMWMRDNLPLWESYRYVSGDLEALHDELDSVIPSNEVEYLHAAMYSSCISQAIGRPISTAEQQDELDVQSERAEQVERPEGDEADQGNIGAENETKPLAESKRDQGASTIVSARRSLKDEIKDEKRGSTGQGQSEVWGPEQVANGMGDEQLQQHSEKIGAHHQFNSLGDAIDVALEYCYSAFSDRGQYSVTDTDRLLCSKVAQRMFGHTASLYSMNVFTTIDPLTTPAPRSLAAPSYIKKWVPRQRGRLSNFLKSPTCRPMATPSRRNRMVDDNDDAPQPDFGDRFMCEGYDWYVKHLLTVGGLTSTDILLGQQVETVEWQCDEIGCDEGSEGEMKLDDVIEVVNRGGNENEAPKTNVKIVNHDEDGVLKTVPVPSNKACEESSACLRRVAVVASPQQVNGSQPSSSLHSPVEVIPSQSHNHTHLETSYRHVYHHKAMTSNHQQMMPHGHHQCSVPSPPLDHPLHHQMPHVSIHPDHAEHHHHHHHPPHPHPQLQHRHPHHIITPHPPHPMWVNHHQHTQHMHHAATGIRPLLPANLISSSVPCSGTAQSYSHHTAMGVAGDDQHVSDPHKRHYHPFRIVHTTPPNELPALNHQYNQAFSPHQYQHVINPDETTTLSSNMKGDAHNDDEIIHYSGMVDSRYHHHHYFKARSDSLHPHLNPFMTTSTASTRLPLTDNELSTVSLSSVNSLTHITSESTPSPLDEDESTSQQSLALVTAPPRFNTPLTSSPLTGLDSSPCLLPADKIHSPLTASSMSSLSNVPVSAVPAPVAVPVGNDTQTASGAKDNMSEINVNEIMGDTHQTVVYNQSRIVEANEPCEDVDVSLPPPPQPESTQADEVLKGSGVNNFLLNDTDDVHCASSVDEGASMDKDPLPSVLSTSSPQSIITVGSCDVTQHARSSTSSPSRIKPIDGCRCRVTTNKGVVVTGDYVVITLPLGVLQGRSASNTVGFNPPLPETHKQALQNIGVGSHNKVLMRFDRVFWPPQQHFNCVNSPLVFANLDLCGQSNVISADCFESSHWSEKSDEEVVSEVVGLLRQMLKISSPLAEDAVLLDWHVTRWDTDPYTMGSYGYLNEATRLRDVVTYSLPLPNKNPSMFFGGEATSIRDPQTIHGAAQSGVRVAAELLAAAHGLNPLMMCSYVSLASWAGEVKEPLEVRHEWGSPPRLPRRGQRWNSWSCKSLRFSSSSKGEVVSADGAMVESKSNREGRTTGVKFDATEQQIDQIDEGTWTSEQEATTKDERLAKLYERTEPVEGRSGVGEEGGSLIRDVAGAQLVDAKGRRGLVAGAVVGREVVHDSAQKFENGVNDCPTGRQFGGPNHMLRADATGLVPLANDERGGLEGSQLAGPFTQSFEQLAQEGSAVPVHPAMLRLINATVDEFLPSSYRPDTMFGAIDCADHTRTETNMEGLGGGVDFDYENESKEVACAGYILSTDNDHLFHRDGKKSKQIPMGGDTACFDAHSLHHAGMAHNSTSPSTAASGDLQYHHLNIMGGVAPGVYNNSQQCNQFNEEAHQLALQGLQNSYHEEWPKMSRAYGPPHSTLMPLDAAMVPYVGKRGQRGMGRKKRRSLDDYDAQSEHQQLNGAGATRGGRSGKDGLRKRERSLVALAAQWSGQGGTDSGGQGSESSGYGSSDDGGDGMGSSNLGGDGKRHKDSKKRDSTGSYSGSHTCQYCNRRFNSSRGIKAHLRQSHSGQPPATAVCSNCGAVKDKRVLSRHFRVCTGMTGPGALAIKDEFDADVTM
eukprot:GHVN01002145.1.p1 GENE.GHVN01002145.1~~GHVN01002145.1.p1  ORF type:complete len:1988 (-),score=431.69 GHVN01002145.1:8842-14805(-)